MINRKQNNSILVLATLGVYLGLVLVGATPQLLAQAAMTREFSVKDEIEVKDDLDTKPKRCEAPDVERTAGNDKKVANSVHRFLSQFHSATGNVSICELPEPSFDFRSLRASFRSHKLPGQDEPRRNIYSILTPTNLPRAGLDALLAKDAK